MSDYSKIVYEFYKKNKICTQCRKRKTNGKITLCDVCNSKMKLRNKKKRLEKIKNDKRERMINHCYKCGIEMTVQNTLCDKCYGEVVIPDYIKNRR